jgi:hypothetical protein
MTKHVSIKVRRLSRISDMANETNQRPTQKQREEATRFEVNEEAKQRSEDRGLSVRRMPKA